MLESMVTEQEPVPEQAPDQPSKSQPELGVGCRLIRLPAAKVPAPETVPPFEGLAVAVRLYCC